MYSFDLAVSSFLIVKYSGCFGAGSGVVSFSSMNTMDDMSDLAFGWSWTQKRPK